MDAKSCKLVAEGHGTRNASNTTNSAYNIDMDSFVTVQ
jgi:hypothetical protein